MAIAIVQKKRTAQVISRSEDGQKVIRNYKEMNNKKLKEGLCVGGKKHTVIQPLQVKITLYLST